jgi:hypothetical protein
LLLKAPESDTVSLVNLLESRSQLTGVNLSLNGSLLSNEAPSSVDGDVLSVDEAVLDEAAGRTGSVRDIEKQRRE